MEKDTSKEVARLTTLLSDDNSILMDDSSLIGLVTLSSELGLTLAIPKQGEKLQVLFSFSVTFSLEDEEAKVAITGNSIRRVITPPTMRASRATNDELEVTFPYSILDGVGTYQLETTYTLSRAGPEGLQECWNAMRGGTSKNALFRGAKALQEYYTTIEALAYASILATIGDAIIEQEEGASEIVPWLLETYSLETRPSWYDPVPNLYHFIDMAVLEGLTSDLGVLDPTTLDTIDVDTNTNIPNVPIIIHYNTPSNITIYHNGMRNPEKVSLTKMLTILVESYNKGWVSISNFYLSQKKWNKFATFIAQQVSTVRALTRAEDFSNAPPYIEPPTQFKPEEVPTYVGDEMEATWRNICTSPDVLTIHTKNQLKDIFGVLGIEEQYKPSYTKKQLCDIILRQYEAEYGQRKKFLGRERTKVV